MEPTEVAAMCEALRHAYGVAGEQDAPTYITVEAGDYEVHETTATIVAGRLLCQVSPTGDIQWEKTQ